MRPWMITVLSDYGRDKYTYQNYEQLFAPSLPKKKLPITNFHVLRIQSAFALLDFLFLRAQQKGYQLNLWELFTKEKSEDPSVKQFLIQEIEGLMKNNHDQFQDYFEYRVI